MEINEKDVILEVDGKTEPGKGHFARLRYGAAVVEFYYDGYEGVSCSDVKSVLSVLGIHPFEIHKS